MAHIKSIISNKGREYRISYVESNVTSCQAHMIRPVVLKVWLYECQPHGMIAVNFMILRTVPMALTPAHACIRT